MIGAFVSWWGRQLWETLPAAWRRSRPAHAPADAVLLALADPRPGQRPGLEVTRRRGQRDVALGRFVLDPAGLDTLRAAVGTARRGAIHLLLPNRLMLEQHVSMPLAAERGLQTALRWEMDRLTPFAAEAVFWSWVVDQRDRARGRLALRLRLVPKAAVEPVLAALTAAGLAPTLLASVDDPARAVPLTGPGPATQRSRLLALSAGAFACALVAVAAAPFVQQELAFRQLESRVAAVRPEVDVAEALRRRLTEREASADVVAAEAARVGDALQILAAVTEVLPDDTYLFTLGLRDRVLTLIGQSGAAAKLIPALASDPAFRDPVFAAPVTRNEITGAEAFTIRTELRP